MGKSLQCGHVPDSQSEGLDPSFHEAFIYPLPNASFLGCLSCQSLAPVAARKMHQAAWGACIEQWGPIFFYHGVLMSLLLGAKLLGSPACLPSWWWCWALRGPILACMEHLHSYCLAQATPLPPTPTACGQ